VGLEPTAGRGAAPCKPNHPHLGRLAKGGTPCVQLSRFSLPVCPGCQASFRFVGWSPGFSPGESIQAGRNRTWPASPDRLNEPTPLNKNPAGVVSRVCSLVIEYSRGEQLQPACLTVSVHPHGSRNAPVGRTTPDWGVVFEASVRGWEGAMDSITQVLEVSQYLTFNTLGNQKAGENPAFNHSFALTNYFTSMSLLFQLFFYFLVKVNRFYRKLFFPAVHRIFDKP